MRNSINVFNYVTVGVCVIDVNYKIICWNNSLSSMTTIEKEDAVGRSLLDIYPEFQKKVNILRINDVALGGPPAIFSATLNKTLFAPKGNSNLPYYYEIIASSMPIEDSAKVYIIFTVEDKTALYKKVNDYKNVKDLALIEIEQRKVVENSLKLANQSKDKFISIMAHDIKNPLGVMQSVSEFLLKTYNELEESEIFEFLEGLYQSSKKVNELINDLLVWARSQNGTISIHKRDFNLFDIVDEEIQLLSGNANIKSIELFNRIERDFIINADTNMIKTVIRNLISNAIKFTYLNGKVFVDSKLKDNYWIISIMDTGVGISDNDMSKLFNLGESVSKPGTEDERGTGLGLLLCKEFIDLHHGNIWAESELGKGSTFNFSIPISQS